MSTPVQPPEPLQANTVEARYVKKKIWSRMWRQNEHFMGVLVGREGSGKSYTGIKLAEVCDPTFQAERVMFEPRRFIEKLRDWKQSDETKGKMVVIDEAGVGVGVRTWHDKDQVVLNQVLQIIRDENMGVIFTLPRLEELDSQTRGRLHAFLEMMEKKQDKWAKVKWLDWDPTRDGRNKIYREYDSMSTGGVGRKIKRLKLTPPSDEIAAAYEERKDEFQLEQYQDAIDQMEDEVEDEMSVKEVAMQIADGEMARFVERHSQNKQPYINWNLIRADKELSQNDAKAVRDLLKRQFGDEQLDNYADE